MLKLVLKLFYLDIKESFKSWDEQNNSEFFRKRYTLVEKIHKTRSYLFLKKVDAFLCKIEEILEYIEEHIYLKFFLQATATCLAFFIIFIMFLNS